MMRFDLMLDLLAIVALIAGIPVCSYTSPKKDLDKFRVDVDTKGGDHFPRDGFGHVGLLAVHRSILYPDSDLGISRQQLLGNLKRTYRWIACLCLGTRRRHSL